MACGTPVVACRGRRAARGDASAGGGGLLVERDDPEALARGIRSAARAARQRRAELGERGRARASSPPTPGRASPQATAAVYAEVLAERAGARPAPRRRRARACAAPASRAPRAPPERTAAGRRSTERRPARQPPRQRDALDDLELEVARRLLAHQVELVAREVVAAARRSAAGPRGSAAAEPRPRAARRAPARDAARQRVEVRDGEHDAPVAAASPAPSRRWRARAVEVVDRSLADHRVEAAGRRRAARRTRRAPSVGSGPSAFALAMRGQRRHARRGLGPDRPGAARRQGDGVLAEAAGHVQDAAARRRAAPARACGSVMRSKRYSLSRRRPRRDDVAHVPVEVDDAHGGRL